MSLEADVFGDEDDEIRGMSTDAIISRTRMIQTEINVHKQEIAQLNYKLKDQQEKIKDNQEKIKLNKQLPYLVANVVEILDVEDEDEEDGGATDVDAQKKGKCAVVKTSTRQTIFLPMIGLVDVEELTPGDMVGVNKDSYLVLEKLPAEYDSRIKAMEVG
jgi:26S proteasome regulatory subunit T5|eukprot:COSAG01_NODE_3443_length_6089_cov_35.575793_1_plen_160_part_00